MLERIVCGDGNGWMGWIIYLFSCKRSVTRHRLFLADLLRHLFFGTRKVGAVQSVLPSTHAMIWFFKRPLTSSVASSW